MKRLLKYILYSSALMLFALPMQAQSLSLDSCKRLALEHNREVHIAKLGEEKAKSTLWAMRTNFLPKLSAQGVMFYSEAGYQKDLGIPPFKLGQFLKPELLSKIPPSVLQQLPPTVLPMIQQKILPALAQQEVRLPAFSMDLQPKDCYFGSIHLDQPIFMGGKILAAHSMAKVGKRAARFKRELKEEEVLYQTEEAFWLYVKAQELHKVALDYQKTIKEVERLTMNAVKAGMRTKNDELKVQVELSKAELKVEQAKHGVRLALMNLNQILGRELSEALAITYDLDSYKLEASSEDALDISARREYALLKEQVELKKQEKRLVRSDFLPHIGVRGSYAYARGGKLNDHLLVDKGGFSAMLTVSVPIFRWGEGFSKVKAARLEQEMAQEELKHFSERMTLELQQKSNIYNEMLLEVQLSKRVLAQAKEHKRVMRNRYEAGLEKMIDYMEAETMYSKASADLIISKTKLALAHSAMLKAKGLL